MSPDPVSVGMTLQKRLLRIFAGVHGLHQGPGRKFSRPCVRLSFTTLSNFVLRSYFFSLLSRRSSRGFPDVTLTKRYPRDLIHARSFYGPGPVFTPTLLS